MPGAIATTDFPVDKTLGRSLSQAPRDLVVTKNASTCRGSKVVPPKGLDETRYSFEMSESEFVISFDDPQVPNTTWQGSMQFEPTEGFRARVIANYDDPRMDPRDLLAVCALRDLAVTANLTDRMLLIDMDREGGGFNLSHQRAVLTERFNAKIAVNLTDPTLQTLESTVERFTLRSPILFSFVDHHSYQTAMTKRGRHFAIKDRPYRGPEFTSQIFSKITFYIGRSMSDASSGNVAKIEYTATATFVPQKPMQLIDAIRCAQFVEKLLFILVGDHCGPLELEIGGGRRKPARALVRYASPLYTNNDVVNGIWRCWTLNKVSLDFGRFLDFAFGRYKQIEVAMELIFDANSQVRTEDKFFRLVRAMEAITREVMPKGTDRLPPELEQIEQLIGAHAPSLKKFFGSRVKSIFNKPNSLGYGINLAKSTFPYPGLATLDEKAVVRLRGIEAHARAHSFKSEQLNAMHNFGMQLDFLCRASLLLALGMTREQIGAGVPNGRFSWLLDTSDPYADAGEATIDRAAS